MKIPTNSFDDIYNEYVATIQWMSNLGLKLDSGRTNHYERTISYWNSIYKSATPAQAKNIYVDFVSSAYEINNLVRVYKAFKEEPPTNLIAIIEKLKKAVNGPIHSSDEKPKSTVARNFLFEVVVAARVHLPSYKMLAILNSPSDTGVKLNGYKIWIECKRITTTNKIEKNAKKASDQLETVFKRKNGSSNRGIIALDISKILNIGDKIFVQKTDEALLLAIDKLAGDFIAKFSNTWNKAYKNKSKKIMGIMIHFSFMCSSEERNLLVNNSQWFIIPRAGTSNANMQLLKSMASIVKNAS